MPHLPVTRRSLTREQDGVVLGLASCSPRPGPPQRQGPRRTPPTGSTSSEPKGSERGLAPGQDVAGAGRTALARRSLGWERS
jgi:hypothetical protein